MYHCSHFWKSEIFFILGLDTGFWKTEVICPGFAKATPGAAVGLLCRTRRIQIVVARGPAQFAGQSGSPLFAMQE